MRETLLALLLLMLSLTPARGDGEATAAPPAVLGIGDATLLALELAPQIEAIRGLKFKRVVPVEIVDDATARAHFDARVAKYWPENRLRDEQTVYTRLGILPEGTDLLALLFDVLEEQAGGYYDPDSGTLFLLDDMPVSIAPILMAHELTHALDDQHYRIDALIDGAGGGSDREAAVGALIEGSGTIVMMSFVLDATRSGRIPASAIIDLQESEAGQAARLTAAPQYVQRSVVGPYILGQQFLLQGDLSALTSGIRPQDLDRAFADPPASTEQILHPEKYWDRAQRDDPRDLDLPDFSSRLGKGWSLRSSGVLGELIMAIVTGAEPIDPLSAATDHYTNEAATGWGGDRWQLYAKGDRSAILLATLWDTLRDAGEFEASLPNLPGRLIERRGDAVMVIAGLEEKDAARLAALALEATAPDHGEAD
ncbi:MAG TPA: hypothetical protein VFG08_00630 [Candidatus Polarisedimenticolia bacterium]|nr:hypothetical protein [Candidatus Polarisedimenticolia bacterium]